MKGYHSHKHICEPIFGYIYIMIKENTQWVTVHYISHIHNLYEDGIIGLLFFLTFIIALIKRNFLIILYIFRLIRPWVWRAYREQPYKPKRISSYHSVRALPHNLVDIFKWFTTSLRLWIKNYMYKIKVSIIIIALRIYFAYL